MDTIEKAVGGRISAVEAAKMLGVNADTIKRMIIQGAMPGVYLKPKKGGVNGSLIIPRPAFMRFLTGSDNTAG
jgi:transposase